MRSDAQSSFFRFVPSACTIYTRVRDSEEPHYVSARTEIERLWQNVMPYVDTDIREKAMRELLSPWWELYLADSLLRQGKKLVRRVERAKSDYGPDLLIESPRAWVEAVAPEDGGTFPQHPCGQAFDIPNEAYILRLTSAFKDKSIKCARYIGELIDETEPIIIAISATKLDYRFQDALVPRIVSSLLATGHLTLSIDRESRTVIDRHLQYRDRIRKNEMSEVETDWFLNAEHAHISAVIYSPDDCINHHDSGFILVHNPLARNPVARGWLGMGREFWMEDMRICHASYPCLKSKC